MATRIKTPPIELHKSDFYAWALTQAELLRDGRLHDLDLEHLIEEIEGLAGSVRSGVQSRAQTIMEHLSKAAALAGAGAAQPMATYDPPATARPGERAYAEPSP